MKHQSALPPSSSLARSLSLCLSNVVSSDVFSQSWNPSPEVLRQRFHRDAPTLRTPANAAALPELTFLLWQKHGAHVDGLKHT